MGTRLHKTLGSALCIIATHARALKRLVTATCKCVLNMNSNPHREVVWRPAPFALRGRGSGEIQMPKLCNDE